MTEGVTQGVPLGVDCADVVILSSLKSPLGILNFCRQKRQKNVTNNERMSAINPESPRIYQKFIHNHSWLAVHFRIAD